MATYRNVLENPQGWRLTHIVPGGGNEQPYDRAAREVNANPSHSKHGPWVVVDTDRHS